MELAPLVGQQLAALAHPLLARAERTEVLRRLGHDVVVQLQHNTAGGALANADVEEDAAACCGL